MEMAGTSVDALACRLFRAVQKQTILCNSRHDLNVVRSVRVGAPFLQETKGAAESEVKIVKNVFKKNKMISTTLLQKFLSFYRNTSHWATHRTLAKLLLGRNTRTQFDILIPSTKDVVIDHQNSKIKRHGKRQNVIRQGDTVAACDYRRGDNKWETGTVLWTK
eukprot:XP_016659116.1 PREDICTED: uncharacterized protein LOC107883493 [Acyrthosiphon pisum]